MTRLKPCAALAPLLLLLACEPAASPREPEEATPAAAPATEAPAAPTPTDVAPTAAAPANPPPAVDGGTPDLSPPVLTPEAERGETGARNILLSFARALELAEYGQAWALLSPADQRKWSEPAFAAMFADFADVSVTVPTGTIDGAAGDKSYTAPVTVTGRDRDGRPVRIEGTAVLRQASVPAGGAGPDLPRWRFETLSLDWTH